ncbi:protocatechuate 3,4-dioxygenase subunit alpha [Bosea sp. 47.2.35]|uniref:protocatechuate 3,4-dioxygenase subunit alpha n=1 Tax=Bosea sp. 47.2.35 TaxID=2969304 RepID=UPI00214F9104|nr:protocatechuate 3,4-dioxygenase subunit alpha [Bosea sp. 47.2.35]MCR4520029.1 protocatechuate 3,4-dioxygenase subunit alpha [Bosea sp. 47.2.35]
MSDASGTTNRLAPLAEDTVGPYYPYSFIDGDRSDLTRLHHGLSVGPQGRQIILRGHLLDSDGQPVEDALVEFWQANAAGILRTPDSDGHPLLDPFFDGFGRLITTLQPFDFKTVKPGPIRTDDGTAARAPHITLTIFSDGITRLVTQVFFDDEAETNEADPLLASLPAALRKRLVARRIVTPSDGPALYEIAIVLRGEGETPFFDDLSS